jgi:hypothetical protein
MNSTPVSYSGNTGFESIPASMMKLWLRVFSPQANSGMVSTYFLHGSRTEWFSNANANKHYPRSAPTIFHLHEQHPEIQVNVMTSSPFRASKRKFSELPKFCMHTLTSSLFYHKYDNWINYVLSSSLCNTSFWRHSSQIQITASQLCFHTFVIYALPSK